MNKNSWFHTARRAIADVIADADFRIKFHHARQSSIRQLDLGRMEERVMLSATPPAAATALVPDPDASAPRDGAESSETSTLVADANVDVDAQTTQQAVSDGQTSNQETTDTRRELAFINDNLAEAEQLIAGLEDDEDRNLEWVVLDSERNGIEQISEVLADRQDMDAMHFLTHGTDAQINLGNIWLNNATLQENRAAIAGWGQSLTDDGDILFYGCQVSSGSDGKMLLNEIATLTGADVAASDDPTGHQSLGGDWELEYQAGTIETAVSVTATAQDTWAALLATPTAGDSTVTTDEDTTYTFSAADFNFSDVDGDTLEQVKITSLESAGSLQLSGVDVTLDQVISRADIDAGNLTFTPAPDANGSGYDSFGFKVHDGTEYSASSYTMTVDVAAMNDAPVNAVPAARSIDHNGMLLFSSSAGTAISVSDIDADGHSIEVALTATNGTLNLSGTKGLTFSVGDGTADASMTFTGSVADINTALEGATFVATPDFTGAASVQIVTDDQGNTGSGGPLSDTDTVDITVGGETSALWLSTDKDVSSPSGAPGLDSWSDDTVIEFGGDGMELENPPTVTTTTGSFSSMISQLDAFSGGDANIRAAHYVTRSLDIGGVAYGGTAPAFTVLAGDVLLTTKDSQTFTSTNSLSVNKEDVFVFRPDTMGDYSSGSFYMLLDNPAGAEVRGITLIERDVTVGGTSLSAGDFLFTRSGGSEDEDVWLFETTDVGEGTTSGAASILLQGEDTDVAISDQLHGIELAETDLEIGGTTVSAGSILLTTETSGTVGSNSLSVQENDIFCLGVEATTLAAGSGNGSASATLLFDGSDVGLDSSDEDLDAISFKVPNQAPLMDATTFSVDENSSDGTVVGAVTASDYDPDDTLQYAITDGNTAGAFAIDANTGEITVANSAALDYETTRSFNLTVAAIDDHGAYGSATITIELNNLEEPGTNDRPENTVPSSQAIDRDGMVLFSAATGTELSISDFDADGNPVQVTLTATNGTFNLSGTNGLSFTTGDGTDDATMTFTGTISDINAALEGSTFVPTSGFTGTASLEMTTDDQGNTGTGGALSATDTVDITVNAPDHTLWMTFENDEDPTDNSDISSITGGDVVTFGDITQLETSNTDPLAATTTGTFSYQFNLDTVLGSDGATLASDGDTRVNAIHRVSRDIQVGSNSVQLLAGDLLLSTDAAETIDGVTYEKEDVFVFRPGTEGDYSQGSFFRLIDGKNDMGWGNVTSVSLVERTTVVGDTTLNAGEFLIAHDGSSKVIHRFVPGTLGDTTSGSTSMLIDGSPIDIGQNIAGVHLVQKSTTLGGASLTAGELLVSLAGDDSNVGDSPTINALRQDIFVLDVTSTGEATTAATARRFFEGADQSLDVNQETIWGVSLECNFTPTTDADTFALDENSPNATVVGTVSASDPEDGTMHYAITAGNTDGAFTIDPTTGQITVANSAALDYETTPTFNLTVAAIDDQGAYGTATVTVNINEVNDAPVASAIEGIALNYTENDGAIAVTSTLEVSDVDDTNIESATIQITGSYISGEDFLAFTDTATITHSWNASTGTLTLTGSDTVANYQAALRSVTYENTSENPNTATRTVSFKVNDGDVDSNIQTRDVVIQAVNDAPVNSMAYKQNTSVDTPLVFSATNGNQISVSDEDAGGSALEITLSGTHGTLTLSGTTGLLFSSGDGTGDQSMTFTGTLTDINNALDGLTFTPDAGFMGGATITLVTDDQGNSGSGGAKSDSDVGDLYVGSSSYKVSLSYGEGTNATPQSRQWDESTETWSSESETTSAGSTVKWVVNEISPGVTEELKAVLSDNGTSTELDLLRWDGSSWTVDWTATAISSANADKRSFDIAYESSSGNAIAVFSDNTNNLKYRVWDGSSWTAEADVFATAPGSGTVLWVEMASQPGSDEISLVYQDSNEDIYGVVWDGSAWLESTTEHEFDTNGGLGGNGDYRSFDVVYEASGDALVAWTENDEDTAYLDYSTRAVGDTVWTSPSYLSLGLSGTVEYVDLAADATSDRVAFLGYDRIGTERLALATWTGSAWTDPNEYDNYFPHAETADTGEFWAAAGWLGGSGEAVVVYSDDDSGAINWATWTSSSGWVVESDVAVTGAGHLRSVQIESFETQDKLMAVFSDSNADLYATTYDGTNWTLTNSGTPLETTLSDANTVAFSFDIAESSVPVLDLPGTTVNYTENESSQPIDSTATVSDVEGDWAATGISLLIKRRRRRVFRYLDIGPGSIPAALEILFGTVWPDAMASSMLMYLLGFLSSVLSKKPGSSYMSDVLSSILFFMLSLRL
ncbi:MAG: DUF4347 domain-containing protein [Pirellulaceae bacterium]